MYVEIFSRFPKKTFLTIIVNLFSGLMHGTPGNSIRLLFCTVFPLHAAYWVCLVGLIGEMIT